MNELAEPARNRVVQARHFTQGSLKNQEVHQTARCPPEFTLNGKNA